MKKKSFYILASMVGLSFAFGACSKNASPVVESSGVSQTPKPGEDDVLQEDDLVGDSESSLIPTSLCAMEKLEGSIICYTASGQISAVLQAPGIDSADPQRIQITKNIADNAPFPLVVYHAWKPDQALLYSEEGYVRAIKETGAFLAVAGAPASPVIAYSETVYENGSSYSAMFAGTPQTLVGADSLFDLKDKTTGLALLPVSVESANEKVQRIWYTQTAWMVGGEDMVFFINRGLFRFDLTTSQNFQVLDNTRNFKGLSPDHTLAGSTDFDLAHDQSMQINDLITGNIVYFPLDSASDRGAGNVVINYDGKLAAWQEAGGSRTVEPPTFDSRIRVGDISKGTIIHDIELQELETVLGWQQVSYINSMGWFNDHTLVAEARGSSWDTTALVLLDVNTGNLKKFCEGSFVGFLYP